MTSDWLFWIAGGLLGIAGLWLAYWALCFDRAKGRKRCPKCWYNMQSAEGLRCPECGHTPKRERKLLKTRRRWRWAFLSGLLLLGSFSLEVVPSLRSSGWRRMSPTTLLVLHAYFADDQDSFRWVKHGGGTFYGYGIVIYDADEEKLADWQWRLMMAHALKRLEKSPVGSPDYEIIDYLSGCPPYAGLAIESLSASLAESADRAALTVILLLHRSTWPSCLSTEDPAVWVNTLIDTLKRVDTKSKGTMVGVLGHSGPDAVIVLPHLLALLEEEDVDLRVAVAQFLADIVIGILGNWWQFDITTREPKSRITRLLTQAGTSFEKIVEVLTELLESDESEEVQLAAAISLCQLGEGTPQAHEVILDHLIRPWTPRKNNLRFAVL